MVTGFIQINLNNGAVNADSDTQNTGSYVFDLNKNINNTTDLISDVVYYSNVNKKQKNNKATVNALKIDQRTIVIKGYNEDFDGVLLNTVNLDIPSIDSGITFNNSEIVPIVIDMSLEDGVIELKDDNSDIVEYEVVSGDSLSSIANKFNITVDTILWANDLNSKSSIRIGQKLVILPVSGLSYKVKSGDTVSGLAQRFNVSERDIVDFNKTYDNKLVIGESIVIPGGKVSSSVKNTEDKKTINTPQKNQSTGQNSGSMAKPIGSGSVKTQGIHGHNGVDFGAPIGTSVYAAMGGVVTLTRTDGGWNGGYGNYIVIKHPNGVQTLYAHLDSVSVDKGETVDRGQVIGRSGNTGKSTGPHLHFEVRGARNPF